jgi:hypothetical protein
MDGLVGPPVFSFATACRHERGPLVTMASKRLCSAIENLAILITRRIDSHVTQPCTSPHDRRRCGTITHRPLRLACRRVPEEPRLTGRRVLHKPRLIGRPRDRDLRLAMAGRHKVAAARRRRLHSNTLYLKWGWAFSLGYLRSSRAHWARRLGAATLRIPRLDRASGASSGRCRGVPSARTQSCAGACATRPLHRIGGPHTVQYSTVQHSTAQYPLANGRYNDYLESLMAE